MSVAVEVRDLVREFGTLRAVDGLSLTVGEGEIIGMLGPNGAGKTTTIRILTTLMRPTGGSASVCGFDVVRQPDEVRRSIGYVMQEIAHDYLHDRPRAPGPAGQHVPPASARGEAASPGRAGDGRARGRRGHPRLPLFGRHEEAPGHRRRPAAQAAGPDPGRAQPGAGRAVAPQGLGLHRSSSGATA